MVQLRRGTSEELCKEEEEGGKEEVLPGTNF